MAKKFFFGLRGNALLKAHLWTVIAFAFTLFGYLQAVAGSLVGLRTFQKQFPLLDTSLKTDTTFHANIEGTTVAVYTLGCFFGALSCLAVSDPLGRVRTVQLGGVIHVVGSVLEATSYEIGQLITGRFVSLLPKSSVLPRLDIADARRSQALVSA